jgi:hypothetical protein
MTPDSRAFTVRRISRLTPSNPCPVAEALRVSAWREVVRAAALRWISSMF